MANLVAIAYDDLDQAKQVQSSLSNDQEAALQEALDQRGVTT